MIDYKLLVSVSMGSFLIGIALGVLICIVIDRHIHRRGK